MINKPTILFIVSGFIWFSSLLMPNTLAASNIDANQKYAWSTNAGWINFRPSHGGVTVYSDHLEGLAWAENIGWVQLGSHTSGGTHSYANTSSTDWGVNNDGAGNLSGYARSLDGSWINFNPTHSQVTINMTTGEFDGYAWSENVGWIHFNGNPTYQVRAEGLSVGPPPPIEGGTTPPPPTLGRAIIIAASGAHRQNTLFRYTEEMTRRMYRILRQRGYTDDDIIYLNPKSWQDIDGDGIDDEVVDDDLFEPMAALEAAFDSAAGLQPGQQFVFYIQGHGLQNQLKITRDVWLPASELRRLVDKVPLNVPQVIIIDSCYSGSFLDDFSLSDDLRPTGQRIVLTSTDADNTAWNARYQSFSEKLISELRRGQTLKTAFDLTESLIKSDPSLFGVQRPQLDDDGDGVYTSRDGKRAKIVLGNEGGRSADAPEIIDVHEPLILAEQQTEGMLWVKTSPSGEGIRRVRALILRPGTQPIDYQGEDTDFYREELEMSYLQERYVTFYSHFRQAGQWRVLYQAQGEDGTWSNNRFGEVQAHGDFPAVVVTARMNQSAYQIGDYLSFKLNLNAEMTQPGPYDLYGAILFPPGYFVTIAYPMIPSLPGVIQPYRQAVTLSQPKTFGILELDLPPGLPIGTYSGCGVVMEPGQMPEPQQRNWIDIDCAGFELR
jgi:hypothetical protein